MAPQGRPNTPDQRRGVSAILPALPKQLLPKPRPVRCIWLFGGLMANPSDAVVVRAVPDGPVVYWHRGSPPVVSHPDAPRPAPKAEAFLGCYTLAHHFARARRLQWLMSCWPCSPCSPFSARLPSMLAPQDAGRGPFLKRTLRQPDTLPPPLIGPLLTPRSAEHPRSAAGRFGHSAGPAEATSAEAPPRPLHLVVRPPRVHSCDAP
jgi:hypothetical protein